MASLIKGLRDIQLNRDLIVTPRLTEYLLNNSDVEVSEDMLEVAIELMTDKSNSDRGNRFGASSRGTCLRAQLFSYLSMPGLQQMDFMLNHIFIDGTWRHIRWQMMLLAAGIVTHVEVPVQKKKLNLKVSIDALNEDEGWLFELKGAHMLPKEVPYKHLLQIHTYFLATGYEKCVYLVECKRTQEWREWVVHKTPQLMEEVEGELDELNRSLREGTLPAPLDGCIEKDAVFRKCPYRKKCLGQTTLPEPGKWG